jgi:hypothetical protein
MSFEVEFVYGGYTIYLNRDGCEVAKYNTDWEIVEVNMVDREDRVELEVYVNQDRNFNWEYFCYKFEGEG